MTEEMRKERVAIAQDVIDRIKIGKLVPTAGTYIETTYEDNEKSKSCDLRDLLVTTNPKCDVCALGALLIAAVARHDRFKVDSVGMSGITGSEIRTFMETWFEEDELLLIEDLFESGLGLIRTDRDRLMFIMQHIVTTGGVLFSLDDCVSACAKACAKEEPVNAV